MRRQHRAHARTVEPGKNAFPVGNLFQSKSDTSLPAGRAGLGVRMAPAVLLGVLRDVEQMREIAERAHHVQRLLDRQRLEQRLELGLHRGMLAGAAKAHRGLADALHGLEGRLARLSADHVAEDAPEQAPVLAQALLGLVGAVLHAPQSVMFARSCRFPGPPFDYGCSNPIPSRRKPCRAPSACTASCAPLPSGSTGRSSTPMPW